VWHLEEKEGAVLDRHIQKFCSLLWAKALGGAVKLYQQAAKLKPPPNDFMPEIRFRDWLSAAYRYAMVLGVPEKRFMAVVRKSKRAAHRGDKYEFLIDAISHEDFDPRKEYTISDLIALGAPSPDEVKNLRHGINRESVRADLAALALDMGYNLRIEKKRGTGEKKERYRFIFTPLQTQSESDRLRKILQSVGIEPDFDSDWDGDVALPAEGGHAPTPEVHTPPPVPENPLLALPRSLSEVKQAVRKAPPAPEPAAIAAQSSPAEVGGGAPFAAPYTGEITPAMQAYLRASDELTNLLTHPELRIVEPKEPELLLIIVETIKGVKKLRELFPILREKDGDNIDALTLGYRTLYACMWGHMSILCGLATFRGLSLEGELPHPKVGWAVVRRVLQEVEGVLNGEEVTLWPLPELRKAPTDPEPTPPPIEAEPKWREAWELFAQIPPGHPARLAILKGLDPDPLLDWEYHTKHRLIRALLNGEAIDPPF
jgi:hypothetical protein